MRVSRRQRYWVPILYLEDGSVVPVPQEDLLPVELPKDVEFSGLGYPHPTWK